MFTYLNDSGHTVSITKVCAWFNYPRRSYYYRPCKKAPVINEAWVSKIEAFISNEPHAGYRTTAWYLGMNKNTVQRIFQLKGWQVKKRRRGFRPRAKGLPSVAAKPNERWSTDLTRVWAGRDRWCTLALVMDCCTRELLGWRLSRSAKAKTAEAALEEALINRYGCLGYVRDDLTLRSDNGLVFSSKSYTRLIKSYGIKQEFITPYTPQQNGMIERLIRTVKEQCVHRHRFESLQHATRVIGDWFGFYNNSRPHQALGMKTPRESFMIAA